MRQGRPTLGVRITFEMLVKHLMQMRIHDPITLALIDEMQDSFADLDMKIYNAYGVGEIMTDDEETET